MPDAPTENHKLEQSGHISTDGGGQNDKAVHLYRQALAQRPDMPEALLNLGRILESTGESEEARSCWSKALEAEPALAQGYFGPAID